MIKQYGTGAVTGRVVGSTLGRIVGGLAGGVTLAAIAGTLGESVADTVKDFPQYFIEHAPNIIENTKTGLIYAGVITIPGSIYVAFKRFPGVWSRSKEDAIDSYQSSQKKKNKARDHEKVDLSYAD